MICILGIASRNRGLIHLLLRHVHPNTSRHPGENGRRDAHRFSRHEHRLVPERSDARNLLSAAAHLLCERVRDLRVCARLDADRLCLCLCRESRCVRLCLRFKPRALRDGLRRCNGRVRLCVGLRLAKYEKLLERRWREGRLEAVRVDVRCGIEP